MIIASGQNNVQLREKIRRGPLLLPRVRITRRLPALLIEETHALVDAYAQILERTLTTYQGRIKPEEARSLLVTAYIQRSKLSFAA
jgi:hypothetical protein